LPFTVLGLGDKPLHEHASASGQAGSCSGQRTRRAGGGRGGCVGRGAPLRRPLARPISRASATRSRSAPVAVHIACQCPVNSAAAQLIQCLSIVQGCLDSSQSDTPLHNITGMQSVPGIELRLLQTAGAPSACSLCLEPSSP
jgi:hypothetical protein